MADLRSLVSELHNALNQKQFDAVNNLMSRAKRTLLLQNALIPTPSASPELIALAREILELGALASIRQTDAPTFTRYYQQLQPFYDLERDSSNSGKVDIKTSQRSKITGLYMLLLLSMGDSTTFHTVLEGLVEEASLKGHSVEDDPYIKYPVELERNLMEGSYDKVWRETNSERVPSEDFGLFSNVSGQIWIIRGFWNVYLLMYYFSWLNRSWSEPSAARSQTAPRRRTLRSRFPTPRTCCSSSRRGQSSSSPSSVDGCFVMDAYTSRLSPRPLLVRRRTSWWPAAPLSKTLSATPES